MLCPYRNSETIGREGQLLCRGNISPALARRQRYRFGRPIECSLYRLRERRVAWIATGSIPRASSKSPDTESAVRFEMQDIFCGVQGACGCHVCECSGVRSPMRACIHDLIQQTLGTHRADPSATNTKSSRRCTASVEWRAAASNAGQVAILARWE